MKDIYEESPRIQNKLFAIRKVTKNDAAELLNIYSDKNSLPYFNSDNCHGDNFYYDNIEKMRKTLDFWSYSYKNHWFCRLVIISRENNKIIGTIEVFKRKSFDSFDGCVVLRIDLKSEYEKEKYIYDILSLFLPKLKDYFGSSKIITKGQPFAIERVKALIKYGFVLSKRKLIGDNNIEYNNYYIFKK